MRYGARKNDTAMPAANASQLIAAPMTSERLAERASDNAASLPASGTERLPRLRGMGRGQPEAGYTKKRSIARPLAAVWRYSLTSSVKYVRTESNASAPPCHTPG